MGGRRPRGRTRRKRGRPPLGAGDVPTALVQADSHGGPAGRWPSRRLSWPRTTRRSTALCVSRVFGDRPASPSAAYPSMTSAQQHVRVDRPAGLLVPEDETGQRRSGLHRVPTALRPVLRGEPADQRRVFDRCQLRDVRGQRDRLGRQLKRSVSLPGWRAVRQPARRIAQFDRMGPVNACRHGTGACGQRHGKTRASPVPVCLEAGPTCRSARLAGCRRHGAAAESGTEGAGRGQMPLLR